MSKRPIRTNARRRTQISFPPTGKSMGTTMIDQLSHGEKVMLFVMGILQDLKAKGIMDGGADLTPEGLRIYEQLQAQGFKVTPDEMQTAIDTIRNTIGIEQG